MHSSSQDHSSSKDTLRIGYTTPARSITGCIWSFHIDNNSATCSFTHSIAFGRIIVVAQCAHRHIHDVTTVNEQWWSMGRENGSELHHWVEFLHNYYMFESVHDGNHDGVCRIFVRLFCKLWGFFNYRWHYVEHFFYYQECNSAAHIPVHKGLLDKPQHLVLFSEQSFSASVLWFFCLHQPWLPATLGNSTLSFWHAQWLSPSPCSVAPAVPAIRKH